MARKFQHDTELISKAFEEFADGVELQPHQEEFCAATQKIVFFGGGMGFTKVLVSPVS